MGGKRLKPLTTIKLHHLTGLIIAIATGMVLIGYAAHEKGYWQGHKQGMSDQLFTDSAAKVLANTDADDSSFKQLDSTNYDRIIDSTGETIGFKLKYSDLFQDITNRYFHIYYTVYLKGSSHYEGETWLSSTDYPSHIELDSTITANSDYKKDCVTKVIIHTISEFKDKHDYDRFCSGSGRKFTPKKKKKDCIDPNEFTTPIIVPGTGADFIPAPLHFYPFIWDSATHHFPPGFLIDSLIPEYPSNPLL